MFICLRSHLHFDTPAASVLLLLGNGLLHLFHSLLLFRLLLAASRPFFAPLPVSVAGFFSYPHLNDVVSIVRLHQVFQGPSFPNFGPPGLNHKGACLLSDFKTNECHSRSVLTYFWLVVLERKGMELITGGQKPITCQDL